MSNCSLSAPTTFICTPVAGDYWVDGNTYNVQWNYYNNPYYNNTKLVDIILFYNNTKSQPIIQFGGIPKDTASYNINQTFFDLHQTFSSYEDKSYLLYVIPTNTAVGSNPSPIPIKVLPNPNGRPGQSEDSPKTDNTMHIIIGVVVGVGCALMLFFIWFFCYKSDRSRRDVNKQ